ncbi:MAG TPA: hypothetical protein VF658_15185 [Pyrinomonadaceae bacterium]|jgi:hypothetical protein
MNIPKHAAGLALFTFIVGASVFIAGLLIEPAITLQIPPVRIDVPPYSRTLATQLVAYKAQFVSLDFINHQSYTTLRLKRDAAGPAPERIWVYTSFFTLTSPLHEHWRIEPVEILNPFANGDEVSLTVAAPCQWSAERRVPRSGFYAKVGVSTVSGEDAIRQTLVMGMDIEILIPVLVQVD